MKKILLSLSITAALLCSASAFATGLATCDSGPEENWIPSAELEKKLTEAGWTIRRVKVDGGCYEVYAINEKGERVEAYFHPLTLELVPTGAEAEVEKPE